MNDTTSLIGLIDRYRSGTESTFSRIFKKIKNRVVKRATSASHKLPRMDVEDISQSILVEFLEGIHGIKAKSEAGFWRSLDLTCVGTCHRLANVDSAKKRNQHGLLPRMKFGNDHQVPKLFEVTELIESLDGDLPQVAALLMQQKSNLEVSKELGISLRTAERKRAQILEAIRDFLF